MSRCPHCFHALSADSYAWLCVSGKCASQPDPEAAALHGAPVSLGPRVRILRPDNAPRSWAPPRVVACPHCAVPAREACPDCGYTLPKGWRQGEVTCIAMAGARATGKSVYVGILIKQLALLAQRLDTTLEPVTERTQWIYSTVYERALYEERHIIASTSRAETQDSHQRDPLIYSLGVIGGRRRFIAIRDVAGEDLEASTVDVPHLQFFAHADGVIFMFDPLRVPEIRDQLQDLVPSQLRSGGDPSTVLGNVLRIIGDGSPRMAVVLSKFDAMQALRSVAGTDWNRVMSNSGAAVMRDAGPTAGAYDDEDGQLVHLEVRSLLQRLGAGRLVSSLERPQTGRPLVHRFFAVSALGEFADGEAVHPRGISPFRCLDPLRWVLAATGAL